VTGVVAQLREFGETRRGWLGVRIQTVTPEIAEGLDLEAARGALVAAVTAGGPAAAAGIAAGDVILSFNGQDIDAMRDLPRIVADTPVGAEVDVEVWRRGATETVSVELGRLEEGERIAASAGGAPAAAALGMQMEPLTEERRMELDLAEDVVGVVVMGVEDGSPAADKAMRPGDVIVEVSQTGVETPADVVALIERAREERRSTVLLLVRSGGDLKFVALSLSDG